MSDLKVIGGLKVVARWKDNLKRNWGGDIVRLEGDLWNWDVNGMFFKSKHTLTASLESNFRNAYQGVYGPPDWTDGSVPSVKVTAKNNDGRDTCYACGAPTKAVMGFMSEYNICTKCGK